MSYPDIFVLKACMCRRERVHAYCYVSLVAVQQGLPRTYNKDLQEDKEPLFDTVSTVHDCLRIAAGVIATMTPNGDNLRAQLVPEMLATDLADYLVRKVKWGS